MRGVLVGVLAVTAACKYHGVDLDDPDGRTDGPSRPDSPPGTIAWRMDTDIELSSGATLAGASVLPRGVVEAEAFAVGLLRVRSSNSQVFTDPATVSWDTLDAITPAATSLSMLPLDTRSRPGGFGLDSDQTWTLWADGEIYLPNGDSLLALVATEHGFVDIETEGTFERVVASSGSGALGTVSAPGAGWYRVRMGMSTNAVQARFNLTIDPQGSPVAQPAFAGFFRVPANTMQGVALLATDEPFGTRRAAQRLYTGPMVMQDWGDGAPDMDLIGPGNFGTRWEGQIRIDVDGDYTFHIDSDDGHRFRIDRQLLSDQWSAGTKDVITAPMTLTPGWHDIVLDHCETGGSARLNLTVESGPEPALVGQPIPATRVRPVTGRGDRVLPVAMLAGLPVGPDVDLDIFTYTPPGATPTFAELAVEIDHPNWSEVHLVLTPPGGGSPLVTVLDDNGDARSGTDWHYATIPAATQWTTGGRWRLRFEDDSSSNDGQAQGYWITVHYGGGSETVRPLATWTSPVHDFTRDQRIDSVTWSSFLPAGSDAATAIALAIRTCAAPCVDEPWVDLPGSGSAPGAPAARYAQVRATFTSDGDDAPWLDWVDVLARDP
jgi:hypothetical protein